MNTGHFWKPENRWHQEELYKRSRVLLLPGHPLRGQTGVIVKISETTIGWAFLVHLDNGGDCYCNNPRYLSVLVPSEKSRKISNAFKQELERLGLKGGSASPGH